MSNPRRTADDFRRDIAAKAAPAVKVQIETIDHGTYRPPRSTPGDIERKERIDRNARDCLRRLKSGQTYEDWRGVGAKMMVITEEALVDLELDEWDADNKQLTREFTRRFEGWEASVSNAKPISKQERWALRQLMTEPKYHEFYSTELLGPEQRKTNHPNKIIEKYNRKYPDPNKPKKEPRKPSPALSPALQERDARIQELQEELEAARGKAAPGPTADVVARALHLVQAMTDEQRAEFIEAVSNVYYEDKPPATEAMKARKATKRARAKPAADNKPKAKRRRLIATLPGIGPVTMEE